MIFIERRMHGKEFLSKCGMSMKEIKDFATNGDTAYLTFKIIRKV